jgi:hypothetical protein
MSQLLNLFKRAATTTTDTRILRLFLHFQPLERDPKIVKNQFDGANSRDERALEARLRQARHQSGKSTWDESRTS